jgi:hypothetical protein
MTKAEPDEQRQPVVHEARASLVAGTSMSAKGTVERGLNDTRLAVLGIIVAIGLTVGFGVQGAWWVRILAGLGAFVLTCVLVRWTRSRHYLMEFVHRLTDR